MGFLSIAHSDVGIKKNTNQDSVLIKEAMTDYGEVLLAVVCDGMGGLAKGEVASAALIRAFSSWFEEKFPEILYEKRKETIEQVFADAKEKHANSLLSYFVGLYPHKLALLMLLHRLHSSDDRQTPFKSLTISFEEAKAFRKAQGSFLRADQWSDLTVDVYLEY